MPRTVLWLGRAGGRDQLLVVDLGNWEPRRGRVLHVQVDTAKGSVQVAELLTGLDRPHGLRKGPDGRIYVGEATRVSRFAWPAASGAAVQLEPVIKDLPAQGRHPLKQIVFAANGSLYINVGAASDRCDKHGAVGADGKPACTETTGSPQAAVYRAQFTWPAGRLTSVQPFALGLRNSMALAAHPSGSVWQGENNIDFDDDKFPAEEVNKLVAGAHYGWPGCVEMKKPVGDIPKAACARTTAPAALMPAHTAPLHMDFSTTGASSGDIKLGMLVSWHGYRKGGQRIVRYETAADGTPKGSPVVLLGPWALDGKSGQRPGAPVGWAEDDQGQLWIADDRNRMLVWLRRTGATR